MQLMSKLYNMVSRRHDENDDTFANQFDGNTGTEWLLTDYIIKIKI